jgi:hypothetical protein
MGLLHTLSPYFEVVIPSSISRKFRQPKKTEFIARVNKAICQ